MASKAIGSAPCVHELTLGVNHIEGSFSNYTGRRLSTIDSGCPPQLIRSGLCNGRRAQLWHDRFVLSTVSIIVRLASDMLQWCGLLLRPRESLEAEILFLRRQLALYRERGMKPRRVDAATRVILALLSRCFDWRNALVVVRPGDADRLAQGGLPILMAMEVASWKSLVRKNCQPTKFKSA
jgi:hypothetical protein